MSRLLPAFAVCHWEALPLSGLWCSRQCSKRMEYQMKSKNQLSLMFPGPGEAGVIPFPAPSPTRTLQILNGGEGSARLGVLRVGGILALGQEGLLLAPSCGHSRVKHPRLPRGQSRAKGNSGVN